MIKSKPEGFQWINNSMNDYMLRSMKAKTFPAISDLYLH